MSGTGGPIIMLYAAGMQQAAASGDLARMRQLAAEAEAHLAQYGNVAAALEVLKVEIAKVAR